MQYMLLIYGNEAGFADVKPEQMGQMMAAYTAYSEALEKAGAWVGGDRLHPSTDAATVSVRNGKNEVLDGPYADTKEQLGGYYIIEAPDMDAAIAWAARCPGAATGKMEVRPIFNTRG